jgi:phosphatidylserine/phosphatidylglycerophosphate/cardiolipin synthase-like enzyme
MGCSSAPSEDAATTGSALAESSYVSDAVLATLAQWPSMQGKTWNVSHDNTFTGNWLLNTPMQPLWGQPVSTLVVPAACTSNCDPDFGLQRCNTQSDCTGGGTCAPVASTVNTPGGAPRSLCVGHSDALYDEMYRVITGAQSFVDVTSLQPPDGRFLAAIRNGITLLSQRPNPPEVRIITGDFPVEGVVNTTTVLKDLTRDLKGSSPIRVAFGAFRSSDVPQSWNHSKMVAADGKVAIVGGHNLWTQHYLEKDPVNDLSIEVHGSAAADAERFANILWKYTCDNMSWATWLTWSVWINQYENGSITSHCPAQFALPTTPGPATGTIITVGRLGTGIQNDGNQADAARVAMLRSAKTTIRMTQQDIGPVKVPALGIPVGSWPDDIVGALADAMVRGVDVYVVLSDLNATAGGLTPSQGQYSNGWSATDVAAHIQSYMQSNPGYPTGADLTSLLCTKLHVAPIRYSSDATWPDGTPFANHAKTLEVDEQAFYVGSQNVYPAGLQEIGFIVDDSRATSQWLSAYWANVWGASKVGAVTGTEAATCALH